MSEPPIAAGDYWTLRAEAQHAAVYEGPPIKGSRFIARAAHVATAEAFDAFLIQCRADAPDAVHHCWGYRLDHQRLRSSDDGEPGGSAGRPILAAIDGAELLRVGVVVARYFGGTKLGVGGLIRAYGGACAEALKRAERVWVAATVAASFSASYAAWPNLERALLELGCTDVAPGFASDVEVSFRIPTDGLERALKKIRDLSGGTVEVKLATRP